jgi:HlyD family secretion protein
MTADDGDKRFWGHLIRVGRQLGRNNLQTDEATEKVDTKILETLGELDSGADLPVGLRVDAFILRAQASEQSSATGDE